MKMHYDEQVDALYLSLDESDVVESEEVKRKAHHTLLGS